MRWPKYWSFSFNIIRSKEIPGLISIRMDWLDLLTVQGTLKSLLQHHSSKALHLAWRKGAAPHPRSGAETRRAPCPRGSSQEELSYVQGKGQQLRGAIPCPRPGAVAGRSNPLSKEWWKGGSEEIPLVQGKEQWLRFARAAVKRYPTSKVRETQVRWYVLQEGIRGQTH